MESQKQFKRRFSFEFFPPKTDQGKEKLQAVRNQLAEVNPDFFSVTFGAGGSTRDRTIETVLNLHQQGISTAPHLSCVGGTREEIGELLDVYKENGINRIVALRGDMPSGMGASGELRYATNWWNLSGSTAAITSTWKWPLTRSFTLRPATPKKT
jgi:methylenetetrahydrofolate reductase (NADPH)